MPDCLNTPLQDPFRARIRTFHDLTSVQFDENMFLHGLSDPICQYLPPSSIGPKPVWGITNNG